MILMFDPAELQELLDGGGEQNRLWLACLLQPLIDPVAMFLFKLLRFFRVLFGALQVGEF